MNGWLSVAPIYLVGHSQSRTMCVLAVELGCSLRCTAEESSCTLLVSTVCTRGLEPTPRRTRSSPLHPLFLLFNIITGSSLLQLYGIYNIPIALCLFRIFLHFALFLAFNALWGDFCINTVRSIQYIYTSGQSELILRLLLVSCMIPW